MLRAFLASFFYRCVSSHLRKKALEALRGENVQLEYRKKGEKKNLEQLYHDGFCVQFFCVLHLKVMNGKIMSN